MNKQLSALAGALALGLPPVVWAQSRADDPTHAQHAAPALRYDSAFADYKPWQDTKPRDWRAVNDALLKDAPQAGGHAGHGAAAAAKPAREPAGSPPAAKQTSAASGAPAGHGGGHGAHGHGSHK